MIDTILVSMTADNRTPGYSFIVFSVSAAVWIIFGLLQKEIVLTVHYCVLLAINLFGIYRWLISKPAKKQPG
ncbi:MAG: hypothetical protein MJA28_03460 [Gammaproteobacteria bacterium]|nr:hypothetical protein [Gammaproteobacteria bacterium]